MSTLLETKFTRIGARAKIEEASTRLRGPLSLDVQRDGHGEFFLIRMRPEAELKIDVIDSRPAERHLLLMVEEEGQKQKFLCGHDERHWFVAAIPERGGVRDVPTAMEALKPVEARQAQDRRRVRTRDRQRRKNEAYIRQGEWFFLPAPDLQVDEKLVFHNEPLSRGAGSKPHVCESAYRTGGTAVYACSKYPSGITEAAYQRVLAVHRDAKSWGWQVRRLNPELYVKGRIRHADHKTIVLRGWHRVLMNTENESPAMRHVVFLD
jgi:hypothetical protein